MTRRGVVAQAADVAAVTMAGDGVQDVLKRVLVSPGEGWDGWVMRLFEIAPGGHTPRHSHPWPHINFVSSGSGELHLSGEDLTIEAGSFAFVPGGEEHQFRAGGEEPLSFICIVPAEGDY